MYSNKRSTPRKSCDMLIQMALKEHDEYREAVASNISRGGVCIRSNRYLSHNTPIYIKPIDPMPDAPDNNVGQAFIAKVRWAKQPYIHHLQYDVGLQYMTRCTIQNLSPRPRTRHRCDLCNCPIESDLHETQDDLFLCKTCFWNLGVLDNSITQSGISRFLSGNVF